MKEVTSSLRRGLSFVCVAGVLAVASHAGAQTSTDRARAQQLFDSGIEDVEAGRFAEACPKFAASQEADPKTSTLLNLGSCYERVGRIASAWGAFREAQGLARRSGRADLEKAARERADALSSSLVRMTLEVPSSNRIPGLVVSRDGSKLAEGEWGVGIPVDRGDHWVSAEAPGHVPWRKKIAVGDDDRTIEVPLLEIVEDESSSPIDDGETPREKSWWTPQRTTGITLVGVGTAAVVTGFVLALVAKGNYDDARSACGNGTEDCPTDAVSRANDARFVATGGTITIIAGGAFIAGGIAIALFGSDRTDAASKRGSSTSVGLLGPQSVGVFGRW